MDYDLQKLQNNAPCPKDFLEVTKSYSCRQMSIVDSILPVDFEPATHCHESYEFLIPKNDMPHARVEKDIQHYAPGKVYPINSGHVHGAGRFMSGQYLTCIMVEKLTMDELTYSLFGRTSISFSNSFTLDDKLKSLINSFIEEADNKQTGFRFIMQNLSSQILVHLIRQSHNNMQLPAGRQPTVTNKQINRITQFMMENYEGDFSLEDLAREADLSPYHFIRAFKSQTGRTPYNYLLDIKIQKAIEMLSMDVSITEICFLCGFKNPAHFTTTFKKRTGFTPSQYRKALLGR